ncbi:DUF2059 domain-containing protein [Pseudoxanthomonas gei]|uniref:DUF2059 domain-containing protein n=1 Tax=Pseudoxanthomonas gei TaxID=1383030 RepID=A0ABX0AGY4_9GAMM|nr:DUF2059 domain-containing protein [Pseudoxanthomonas gei]NDK39730.1 DUF2059 domain-containing protein [Pseudoxanthomonas gei]
MLIPRPLSRLLAATLLALCTATALAAPPTDADIERLLKASRAESMLIAIQPQMQEMQRQQFAQITAGKQLTAEQKADVDRIQARTTEIVRKTLSWQEMRPLYIDVYKKTFTSQDVKAIAKFYESPAGRSLLDKTPALMQNLMAAIQQKVVPMMEELQTELKESTKPLPAPEVTPPAKRKKKK